MARNRNGLLEHVHASRVLVVQGSENRSPSRQMAISATGMATIVKPRKSPCRRNGRP